MMHFSANESDSGKRLIETQICMHAERGYPPEDLRLNTGIYVMTCKLDSLNFRKFVHPGLHTSFGMKAYAGHDTSAEVGIKHELDSYRYLHQQ